LNVVNFALEGPESANPGEHFCSVIVFERAYINSIDERRPSKNGDDQKRLWERSAMETFFIIMAIAAMSGVCVWLFVVEPRRKIYDR
jgi:hypothetical protein